MKIKACLLVGILSFVLSLDAKEVKRANKNKVGSMKKTVSTMVNSDEKDLGFIPDDPLLEPVINDSKSSQPTANSIDPDKIRSILRANVPNFKVCYQTVLDNAKNKEEYTGIVILNFVIGSSGTVTKYEATGDSNLTPEIKDCVINVLKGISFPEMSAGGTVEVKQPINFYPRRLNHEEFANIQKENFKTTKYKEMRDTYPEGIIKSNVKGEHFVLNFNQVISIKPNCSINGKTSTCRFASVNCEIRDEAQTPIFLLGEFERKLNKGKDIFYKIYSVESDETCEVR